MVHSVYPLFSGTSSKPGEPSSRGSLFFHRLGFIGDLWKVRQVAQVEPSAAMAGYGL